MVNVLYFVSGFCVARPIVLSISPSSQSVEEGGSVAITCTANVGRPTGYIRWMKSVGTAKEDISDQVGFISCDWLGKIM